MIKTQKKTKQKLSLSAEMFPTPPHDRPRTCERRRRWPNACVLSGLSRWFAIFSSTASWSAVDLVREATRFFPRYGCWSGRCQRRVSACSLAGVPRAHQMACLNTLKQEIKTLESVFPKSHERFQIMSASVDELSCRFVGKNGKKYEIHANITVSINKSPHQFLSFQLWPQVKLTESGVAFFIHSQVHGGQGRGEGGERKDKETITLDNVVCLAIWSWIFRLVAPKQFIFRRANCRISALVVSHACEPSPLSWL